MNKAANVIPVEKKYNDCMIKNTNQINKIDKFTKYFPRFKVDNDLFLESILIIEANLIVTIVFSDQVDKTIEEWLN